MNQRIALPDRLILPKSSDPLNFGVYSKCYET
jgi:hypothetical protein